MCKFLTDDEFQEVCEVWDEMETPMDFENFDVVEATGILKRIDAVTELLLEARERG